MVSEGTLSDAPQSGSQTQFFLPFPCPHTNHSISRMPGHIGPSPNELNTPSPDLGTEERKGVRSHEFSMFFSKQDSGPKVDFNAASGQS